MSLFSNWIDGSYVWVLIFIIVLFFTFLTILFYYTRDKYEPEPITRVFYAFLLGIFSVIPAMILSLIGLLIIPVNSILVAVLLAPVVEEFCKGWMVIYLSRNDDFDGPLDGLIYGAMVGSGFAAAENLVYGFYALYSSDGGIFLGLTITTFRSLTQIIGHPLYTGLMGAGVGQYKVGLTQNKYQQIWRSITLHAMWNGATYLGNFFILGIIGVIIVSIYILKNELSSAITLDRQAYERGYYEAKKKYLEYKQRQIMQQQQWQAQKWQMQFAHQQTRWSNQYQQHPSHQTRWPNQYQQHPPPQTRWPNQNQQQPYQQNPNQPSEQEPQTQPRTYADPQNQQIPHSSNQGEEKDGNPDDNKENSEEEKSE